VVTILASRRNRLNGTIGRYEQADGTGAIACYLPRHGHKYRFQAPCRYDHVARPCPLADASADAIKSHPLATLIEVTKEIATN